MSCAFSAGHLPARLTKSQQCLPKKLQVTTWPQQSLIPPHSADLQKLHSLSDSLLSFQELFALYLCGSEA